MATSRKTKPVQAESNRAAHLPTATSEPELTPEENGGNIVSVIMGAYDGIYRSSARYPGLALPLDKLLQQKTWQTPQDMLNHAACRAPFNLKRYSLLSEEYAIVPAITDPYDTRSGLATAYADYIRWCCNNIRTEVGQPINFFDVIFQVARGMWEGFRLGEIGLRYLEDGPYSGLLGWQNVWDKACKQIGFDLDPQTLDVLHVTSYTPGSIDTGPGKSKTIPGGYQFDVPIERCLLYTYNPQDNTPFGMGDWRGCHAPWWSVLNLDKFWIKALERWGGPVLVTFGPKNSQPAQLAAQKEIRNGGDAALPDNVKMQLVQAAQGIFQGYEQAVKHYEMQMSRNILCSTLTTSAEGGTKTNALGNVHSESEETVVSFGQRGIAAAIRLQLFDRLLRNSVSGYVPELCPVLQLTTPDDGDILEMAQAMDIAIKDGVVWKRNKEVRAKFGLAPLDPQEQAELDKEQQAQEEAAQQIADARVTNKIGALARDEAERAVASLTRLLLAKAREENN